MTETTLYLDQSWAVDDSGDVAMLAHAAHIGDVLDNLPFYMRSMRNLKSADPDTYGLIASIGGPIATRDSLFSIKEINHEFLAEMPAFRCVLFSDVEEKQEDAVYSVGYYIVKTDEACDMQATNHQGYRLGMIWRDEATSKRFFACEGAYISISKSGEVSVLKELRIVPQNLPRQARTNPRTGHRHGGRVMHYRWVEPDWIKSAASHNNETPTRWLRGVVSVLSWAKPEPDGIVVRVSDGKTRCAFTVGRKQGARFFRHRDKDGGKVLHYVRGHYRADPAAEDGERFVRPHYRGNREITWMGYSVSLSVPDWHHNDFMAWKGAQSIYGEDEWMPSGTIDPATAGRVIGKSMDQEFFLSKSSYGRRQWAAAPASQQTA